MFAIDGTTAVRKLPRTLKPVKHGSEHPINYIGAIRKHLKIMFTYSAETLFHFSTEEGVRRYVLCIVFQIPAQTSYTIPRIVDSPTLNSSAKDFQESPVDRNIRIIASRCAGGIAVLNFVSCFAMSSTTYERMSSKQSLETRIQEACLSWCSSRKCLISQVQAPSVD